MSWLARRLAAEGIGFTAADNAFAPIDDRARAQELADGFSPDRLHRVLDHYAALCCPVLDVFAQAYPWSLMQVEYGDDLVFRSAATLGPLYEQLIRESVLSVKVEQSVIPSNLPPFGRATALYVVARNRIGLALPPHHLKLIHANINPVKTALPKLYNPKTQDH